MNVPGLRKAILERLGDYRNWEYGFDLALTWSDGRHMSLYDTDLDALLCQAFGPEGEEDMWFILIGDAEDPLLDAAYRSAADAIYCSCRLAPKERGELMAGKPAFGIDSQAPVWMREGCGARSVND